jgi:hypothetical protein
MKTNFVAAAVAVLALTACQNDLTGPMTIDTTTPPSPAVTYDFGSGEGFIGKGDVQYTYGWNDRDLQANAKSVKFRVASQTVFEVSWECTNEKNEKIQEREQTTTISLQGLLTTVTRDNKSGKVTGFKLEGYDGLSTSTTSTEGPAVNSCPGDSGNGDKWTLTSLAGAAVEMSSLGGGFDVSSNGGGDWTSLLTRPEPII